MSDIGNIIGDTGFKFNKRYGQNFITDVNLLDAIVRDAGIDGGVVLESRAAGRYAHYCARSRRGQSSEL